MELIGTDTFNPVGDLTLPMLASIRQATEIPMDIYVYYFDPDSQPLLLQAGARGLVGGGVQAVGGSGEALFPCPGEGEVRRDHQGSRGEALPGGQALRAGSEGLSDTGALTIPFFLYQSNEGLG